MSMPDTSPAFFEAKYRESEDPWNFAADEYEQFRYRTILQALQPGPYRHGFEPGCSVGVLTEQLATLCAELNARDVSPSAVAKAQQRCAALPGVRVQCGSLRDGADYAAFDLVVFSEIGYYSTGEAWQRLVQDAVHRMRPGTVLLASHWLGYSADHILSGDEVHTLISHTGLRHDHAERHPHAERGGFRLDRWVRLP